QDLEKMVENKLFREDLYYRLKVINIKLPPLSERKEDIPQLVYHFIRKFNKKFDKNINGISSEALNFLRNKEWKGNVRELENEIEKAVLLCNDTILSLEYLKDADNRDSFSLFDNIPEKWKEYQNYKNRIATTLDANYIKRLLKTANGNIRKASKLAGISRTQIYRLLNKEK
ncbi:MAG: sigma-54-dependent Fis family transcriptional regulator, partial [Candidatus Cloacimonadota bacterium]